MGRLIGGVVALVVLWGVMYAMFYFASTEGPKPGMMGVCQTGGIIEGDNGTCGVMPSGTKKRALGVFNSLRQYPATTRNFTFGPGGELPQLTLATKDGKRVGVQIRFNYKLNPQALTEFYKSYGLREYADAEGNQHRVYTHEGWVEFLKQEFGPVGTQALRGLFLTKTGQQLAPAFAAAENPDVDFTRLDAEGNLSALEGEAGMNFDEQLRETLGGDFFTDVRVTQLNVVPPQAVLASVDKAIQARAVEIEAVAKGKADKAAAQAAAQVSNEEARAKRYAAVQEAIGIRAKSRAYQSSPEKASVDAIAALPDTLTTLILGGKSSNLLQLGK